MELWDKFPKTGVEVNIWSRDLSDFKRFVRRVDRGVVFTEAYIGRWDLLASEVYGDPYLWWVLPLANDILDLFAPELVGEILGVPGRDVVWEWMNYE